MMEVDKHPSVSLAVGSSGSGSSAAATASLFGHGITSQRNSEFRSSIESLLRQWKRVEADQLTWSNDRNELIAELTWLKKEKAAADNKIGELQARIRMLELGAKEERVKVVGSKITAAANAAVAGTPSDDTNASPTSTTSTTDGKRRPITATASAGGRKQLSFESWKELRRSGVSGQRSGGNVSTWTLPGRIPSEVITDLSSYKAAAAAAAAAKANASSTTATATSPTTPGAGEGDDAPVRLAPTKKKRPSMSVPLDAAATSAATSVAKATDGTPIVDGVSPSPSPSATTPPPTSAPSSPLMSSTPAVHGNGVDFVSLLQKQSAESKIPQGKMWKPRITLRNHMDGVRAVAFDQEVNALISGSEDGTAKWWNIDAAVHPLNKKKVVAGLEPVYTFLGHRGMVTSTAVKTKQKVCFTGSIDGNAIMWNIPPLNADGYDAFGNAAVHRRAVYRHGGAIWDVVPHPSDSSELLFTACSDGNVYTWTTSETGSYLRTVSCPELPSSSIYSGGLAAPASISVQATDPSRLLIGYTNGALASYDIETGRVIALFADRTESGNGGDAPNNRRITKVVSHPLLPLCITAHVDKVIRWFDIDRAESVQLIKAHRDVVSSIALDSVGLNLVSGGHDQAIRFWDMTTSKIVQDLDPHQSHKTKYDEAVHCVTYHPTADVLVSGGADSLVKVYT